MKSQIKIYLKNLLALLIVLAMIFLPSLFLYYLSTYFIGMVVIPGSQEVNNREVQALINALPYLIFMMSILLISGILGLLGKHARGDAGC